MKQRIKQSVIGFTLLSLFLMTFQGMGIISGSALVSQQLVLIESDLDLAAEAISGMGSAEDPYLLDYGTQSATGHVYGIIIKNTRMHFILNDTHIDHAISVNLLISNVTNGLIEHCSFSNGGQGMTLENSADLVIDACEISENINYGIELFACNTTQILASNISCNLYCGIRLHMDRDIFIWDNTINENTQYGVYMTNCERVNIENNDIVALSGVSLHGIVSDLSSDVYIYDFYVYGFENEGIFINNSEEVELAMGTSNQNHLGGIRCYNSNQTVITDLNVTGNLLYGLKMEGGSGIVTGCNFHYNDEFGLLAAEWEGNIVSNNFIGDVGDWGLKADGCGKCKILDNFLVDAGNGGIWLYAVIDSLLAGNTIGNTTGSGITAEICENIIIRDNEILNNSLNGMELLSSFNFTVHRNIVDGNDQRGLSLEGTHSCDIAYNEFVCNGEEGLSMFDSDDNDVVWNLVAWNDGGVANLTVIGGSTGNNFTLNWFGSGYCNATGNIWNTTYGNYWEDYFIGPTTNSTYGVYHSWYGLQGEEYAADAIDKRALVFAPQYNDAPVIESTVTGEIVEFTITDPTVFVPTYKIIYENDVLFEGWWESGVTVTINVSSLDPGSYVDAEILVMDGVPFPEWNEEDERYILLDSFWVSVPCDFAIETPGDDDTTDDIPSDDDTTDDDPTDDDNGGMNIPGFPLITYIICAAIPIGVIYPRRKRNLP